MRTNRMLRSDGLVTRDFGNFRKTRRLNARRRGCRCRRTDRVKSVAEFGCQGGVAASAAQPAIFRMLG